MRLVIQKVTFAKVKIDSEIYSSINKGLLVFIGISQSDSKDDADFLIQKLLKLRLFEHENKIFEKSISDQQLEMLVVSQFTLYADLHKGNRPAFFNAMNPKDARILYNYFIENLEKHYSKVKSGKFGAVMQIELENDGPITLILDS